MTNPSYQAFFDKNSNVDATDPYEIMGYKNPSNAQMRYNSVLKKLRSVVTEQGLTVLDAGAGTGTMWTHFLDSENGQKIFAEFGFDTVYLVDSCEPTRHVLQESADRLNAKTSTKFVILDQDFLTDLPEVDIVTSVGALNYYTFNDFVTILNNFDKASRVALILESNLQTPHTSTDAGTWNPSNEVMFQFMYSKFLSDGQTRVEVEYFKKWTSVWTVRKVQK